jgi:hypothetical protein
VSKVKPWPTVANRHRTRSIFLAGGIRKHAETIIGQLTEDGLLPTEAGLTSKLREAVKAGNLKLALALISAIEGHTMASAGQAQQIIDTLEAAPSDPGDLSPNGSEA